MYIFFKRAFDIVVSFFLLILLSPVFLIIAILIKVNSPGSVFIGVKALRKDGRTFNEWKFRTMIENADEFLNDRPDLQSEFLKKFKLVNDPRVNGVGKFLRRTSLNELPQLFNVVMGSMSLVGPRSIAVGEEVRYGPLYKKMLSVPSGMTGLWQINGRQDTTYEKRVELDMFYIDHRSFRLDLKIILKTIPAVISRKGAY